MNIALRAFILLSAFGISLPSYAERTMWVQPIVQSITGKSTSGIGGGFNVLLTNISNRKQEVTIQLIEETIYLGICAGWHLGGVWPDGSASGGCTLGLSRNSPQSIIDGRKMVRKKTIIVDEESSVTVGMGKDCKIRIGEFTCRDETEPSWDPISDRCTTDIPPMGSFTADYRFTIRIKIKEDLGAVLAGLSASVGGCNNTNVVGFPLNFQINSGRPF